MSTLLSCHNLTKTFGGQPVFQGLDLTVRSEERIGLIGANGSGKSTLCKILAGSITADEGDRMLKKNLRVSYVAQDPIFQPDQSILQILMAALDKCQVDPTERSVRVSTWSSLLGFDDPDQKVEVLSGGWQKRLAIACAMVVQPDLLLLDEPTNHLDLSSILWLETMLKTNRTAFVAVSHDRLF